MDETEFFVKATIGTEGHGPLQYFLKPNDLAEAVLYILSTAPYFHVSTSLETVFIPYSNSNNL